MSDQQSNDDALENASEEQQRDGFSRRGFLVGAAGLTGVALSGVWKAAPALASEGTAAPAAAGTTGGLRFLELDGVVVGSVKSVSGGEAYADVVLDPPQGDAIVHKHIGGVKYEDFTVQVGMGMSKPMYEWIKASFDHKAQRKNGAIIAADFDLNAKSRHEFDNALITEIGFPACDAASKDAAYLTLKFAPEITRHKVSSGKVSGRPSNQKMWLPSNFRLTLGNLPSSKVSKIDSFTVKQNVVETPGGRGLEPTSLEFPNLAVTFPESKAWSAFFEDFVVNGNSGDDKELTGRLEVLAPDLSRVLLGMDLQHVGIFGLDPKVPEPNALGIRRFIAELYCEQMTFAFKPSLG